jgi:cytoskeletal protein CcmA (bactofilin family)
MATNKELTGAAGDATVIGPSILISGRLSGDEDLTVRGRVEGELSLTRTLIVETSGVVKADVTVRNAVISGVVVGNITATESVELTREGRMVGDLRSPRVIIVDGASFRGRVDMGNAEPVARTDRAPAARPVTTAVSRPAAAPARVATPPRPPPPPMKTEARKAEVPSGRPAPPPPPRAPEARPPTPPNVGMGMKKKLMVRKKGR